MVSPALICLYMLTAMPVKICTTPSTSAPTSTFTALSRGSNSLGRAKVLPGFISWTSWGIRSPKKPPVAAPHRKVLTPHSPSRGIMYCMVAPSGLAFLMTTAAAIIMIRP